MKHKNSVEANMSSRESWERIDRIFAAALLVEPERRAAFLDDACGSDKQLRREVESLLANDVSGTLGGRRAIAEASQLVHPAFPIPDPEFVGRYKIVRPLGFGGMGRVYLAHDVTLNRSVAIKLLSPYSAEEDERIRRFQQEALAASALNHPNILTIYETGENQGINFIATEFVDGQTLRERIASGPLSITDSLEVAAQIAGALAAAHRAGIIHRDIKPANIMLRADGLVKILDFGAAKYSRPDDSQATAQAPVDTSPGLVVGTASYMAPEQARGLPVDARSDLWSLGVVLYEMVTGSALFSGETPMDVLAAVITGRVPALSGIPDEFERIIQKALQRDPEARYQSAVELRAELTKLAKRMEFAEYDQPVNRDAARHSDGKRSIAVLPFVNMSADPENEYFCDGLSEELINALNRVEELEVAARTSAFSFKGKGTTISGISRTLGVNSILEGSVRKSGSRLRITVQLVNADGYHLWSERYDRELKDIFEIQDEIALAVVAALKVTLIGEQRAAVLKRYTENVEAYQLYLKGRYYWWKTQPEEFAKGKQYFESAVEADPSYALSYCGISSYYGFGAAFGMVPPQIGWPKSIMANAKALELDDSIAEVHTNMGGVSMVYLRDVDAAERQINRALEVNPRFQEAHYIHSNYLVTRGRFDEALAEAAVALNLDPFSTRLNHNLGNCYYFARRYDEAITQLQKAIELDTHNPLLYESLAEAFERQGQDKAAVRQWQRVLKLTGQPQAAEALGNEYAKTSLEKALSSLAGQQLQDLNDLATRAVYVPAIKFARAYLRLGNFEQAIDWLRKAADERNMFALYIKWEPFYDRLRSDSRFMQIEQALASSN